MKKQHYSNPAAGCRLRASTSPAVIPLLAWIVVGLVWLVTLMVQTARFGLTEANRRRLMCLSMFWHFLDVVWIGVFTFVYLLGMLR